MGRCEGGLICIIFAGPLRHNLFSGQALLLMRNTKSHVAKHVSRSFPHKTVLGLTRGAPSPVLGTRRGEKFGDVSTTNEPVCVRAGGR